MSTNKTLYRRAWVNDIQVRDDGEGRTLSGTCVPYGVNQRVGHYVETFTRGAFADSLSEPGKVMLLVGHDHTSMPIGRALSLTETDAGLVGEFRVSDTVAGNDVLTLVKDGAVSGLSIGFTPVAERWNTGRDHVERTQCQLLECSVVAFPMYDMARIEAVRAREADPRRVALALARRRLA